MNKPRSVIIFLMALVIMIMHDIVQADAAPLRHNRELEDSCGENEEWTTCKSSSCFDKICDDVLEPTKMRPCTRDCKSGCTCKEGYVRESDGNCYEEDICIDTTDEE